MRHQSSRATTVEATVFDSAPRASFLGALLPVGLVAIGLVAPHFIPLWIALLLVRDLSPRQGPKRTKLVCTGGAVVIPGSGAVRARDLLGATTCRHGDGVSLMLHHKRRRLRPIILDLPSEEALTTVCRALGIGHHGFGWIDAAVTPPNGQWLRTASALASLLLLLPYVVSNPGVIEGYGGFFALSFLAWIIAALATWRPQGPTLRMASGGVYVPLRTGSTLVPFRDIERIEATRRALRLTIETPQGRRELPVPISPSRWTPRGPSLEELAHVTEQIQAAADRAHGRFVAKAEPEALASMLARGEHESVSDWHARIDTIAVGTGGYRTTSADASELWALLEDPEADASVRAAAARLLSRHDKEGLRVRVADVLASVRDEQTRTRIADSIEDDEDEEAGLGLTAAR